MSKLNLIKPQSVVIEMKGVEYDLVYDFNAFAELEKAFGDIQTAFDKLTVSPKFADILTILQAGLMSNENPPTKKELGSYLTPTNINSVVEIIGEALNIAMPVEEKVKKEKN